MPPIPIRFATFPKLPHPSARLVGPQIQIQLRGKNCLQWKGSRVCDPIGNLHQSSCRIDRIRFFEKTRRSRSHPVQPPVSLQTEGHPTARLTHLRDLKRLQNKITQLRIRPRRQLIHRCPLREKMILENPSFIPVDRSSACSIQSFIPPRQHICQISPELGQPHLQTTATQMGSKK